MMVSMSPPDLREVCADVCEGFGKLTEVYLIEVSQAGVARCEFDRGDCVDVLHRPNTSTHARVSPSWSKSVESKPAASAALPSTSMPCTSSQSWSFHVYSR